MSTCKTWLSGAVLILALICQGCGGGGGGAASTAGTGGSEGTTVAAGGSGTGGTTGATSGATDPGSTSAQPVGVAKLSWNAPQQGAAGFKVYYGSAPGTYGKAIDVGLAQGYTVSGLPAGTYYFAVTTYDATGSESPYSNEVTKSIN